MIAETYTSFEVARLLKDKGFPQSLDGISAMYDNEGAISLFSTTYRFHTFPEDFYESNENIVAPTHQMAVKWLRDRGIIIQIEYIDYEDCKQDEYWDVSVWVTSYLRPHNMIDLATYSTYEDATEAALKYCLKNLI